MSGAYATNETDWYDYCLYGGTAVAATAVAATVVYHRSIRPRLKFTVECWFCRTRCSVPQAKINAWTCSECCQYNGFNADGDYNWQDPAKHALAPACNQPRFTEQTTSLDPSSDNGLCQSCNLNQSLKVHQLATFVPHNESDFDREAEAYAEHLERTYRLCRRCEAILHQTLGEQNSKLKPGLLSWRLETGRRVATLKKPETHGFSNSASAESPVGAKFLLALRTLTLVAAALASVMVAQVPELETLLSVVERSVSLRDLVTGVISSWVLCGLLWPTKAWMRSNMPTLIFWLLLYVIVGTNTFASYVGERELSHVTLAVCSLCLISAARSVRSSYAHRVTSPPPRRPKPSASSNPFFTPLEDDQVEERTRTPLQVVDDSTVTNSLNQSWSFDQEMTIPFELPDEKKPYEGNCDISTLSLEDNDDLSPNTLRANTTPSTSAGTFSLRSYSPCNSSGINFGGGYCGSDIIRPARFKPNKGSRVVRASWVAGGYWQQQLQSRRRRVGDDDEDEEVSRSSSQSSGFVSQSSAMLPPPPPSQQYQLSLLQQQQLSLPSNSRANSLCDRFSVLSEPIAGGGEAVNMTPPFQPGGSSLADVSFFREDQNVLGKPTAKSSPIPTELTSCNKASSKLLEYQVNINCSLYSLLLTLSACLNVSACAYLLYYHLYL